MKMRCKEVPLFFRRHVKKEMGKLPTGNLIDIPVNENPIDFIQSKKTIFHFTFFTW